jgi:hypothetical protein
LGHLEAVLEPVFDVDAEATQERGMAQVLALAAGIGAKGKARRDHQVLAPRGRDADAAVAVDAVLRGEAGPGERRELPPQQAPGAVFATDALAGCTFLIASKRPTSSAMVSGSSRPAVSARFAATMTTPAAMARASTSGSARAAATTVAKSAAAALGRRLGCMVA